MSSLTRGTLLITLMRAATQASQNRSPHDLGSMPTAATGTARIPYGADSLQFGELRVPGTAGPHSVAIVATWCQ